MTVSRWQSMKTRNHLLELIFLRSAERENLAAPCWRWSCPELAETLKGCPVLRSRRNSWLLLCFKLSQGCGAGAGVKKFYMVEPEPEICVPVPHPCFKQSRSMRTWLLCAACNSAPMTSTSFQDELCEFFEKNGQFPSGPVDERYRDYATVTIPKKTRCTCCCFGRC